MVTRGLLFELQVCNSKVNKNTIFSVSFFFFLLKDNLEIKLQKHKIGAVPKPYTNTFYTLYNLSLGRSLLHHPLLKAWECQHVPSLGPAVGDQWAQGTLGVEDDGSRDEVWGPAT